MKLTAVSPERGARPVDPRYMGYLVVTFGVVFSTRIRLRRIMYKGHHRFVVVVSGRLLQPVFRADDSGWSLNG